MSTTTSAQTRHGAGTVSRAAGRWRITLLVWLGLVVVATLLTGTRPADLADLERGLRSGTVTQVHLVGALEAGAVGHVHAEVEWHDGVQPRYTAVQQVRSDADNQFFADSGSPVVGNDLAGQMRAWTPSGELRVTTQDHRPGLGGELYGWHVPGWVALAGMPWSVVTFFTLLGGPQPRLATRWAWFWIFWGTGGLAMVAYAILGLPRTGQPNEPEGRRLTGGWAFLLAAVVLAPMLSG